MKHRPPVPTLVVPRPGRQFGRGIVGSVLIHGLVVGARVIGAGVSDEVFRSIGTEGPLGGGGGGGGSRISYIELPSFSTAQAPAQVSAPEPTPAAELPIARLDVKSVPIQTTPLAVRSLGTVVTSVRLGVGAGSGGGPGTGSGTGGGIGSGDGTGVGSGTGPGTGGVGNDGFPPQPRHVLLPPEAPKSIKGREFHVRFWIDELGRVTRVEEDPRIEDAGYRKRFLERMHQFTFYPARTSAGAPVRADFVIPITP